MWVEKESNSSVTGTDYISWNLNKIYIFLSQSATTCLQSATAFLLQSATAFCYKVRQLLLQSSTVQWCMAQDFPFNCIVKIAFF